MLGYEIIACATAGTTADIAGKTDARGTARFRWSKRLAGRAMLHQSFDAGNGFFKTVIDVEMGGFSIRCELRMFRQVSPSLILEMCQVVWLMALATI